MKKQVICEYCGKVFEDKDYEYNKYLLECAKHEITHLNLYDNFRKNLEKTLQLLDKNFSSESYYTNLQVSVCYGEMYYGKHITYSFILSSNKFKKSIPIKIEIQYKNKEHIPNEEEIIDIIGKYYIANINKKYKGVISFEDWNGGNGADDYMIGDRYIREIFEELKGKQIEIKIID